MPSPIEFTSLVKSAGGEFQADLLHDPNLSTKYQGLKDRAVILGVYGADLSYTSVYNQQQYAIKILAASKRLGEEIGVQEAFSADLMERANANLGIRDSMLVIMTEMYWQTNSQLKEENRNSIAFLVMLGGWVEGLYLGAQNLNPKDPDVEISRRLVEQKFTAMQISELFVEFEDDPIVAEVKPTYQPLIDKFLSFELKEENTAPELSESNGVVTIGGSKELLYSDKDLAELQKMVSDLRAKIIAI